MLVDLNPFRFTVMPTFFFFKSRLNLIYLKLATSISLLLVFAALGLILTFSTNQPYVSKFHNLEPGLFLNILTYIQ